MNIETNKTIGEIVANNFKTAAIFKKYHIDFCCKGNLTLEDVCLEKGFQIQTIKQALEETSQTKTHENIDFNSWDLELLCMYIEKIHHRYVEEKTSVILSFLDKTTKVHSNKHPELLEIRKLFTESAIALSKHIKKEELILFPFIKQMAYALTTNNTITPPTFENIAHPIAKMKEEHENEGLQFEKIRQLTQNYTPPIDACQTFKVTYQMLEAFEDDLHTHIHLENNILFPKALLAFKKFEPIS